jgi:D-alanine-D-alanine ligase
MQRLKVAVLMGGPSSEHAVSLASGTVVYRALAGRREFEVKSVVIAPDGQWRETIPTAAEPAAHDGPVGSVQRDAMIEGLQFLRDIDVAFLCFHGTFGEGGRFQGLLECLGIAYTGSGPLASALAMNKAQAKAMLECRGVKTPKGMLVRRPDVPAHADAVGRAVADQLGYPVVVKPNQGGSSVGTQLAQSWGQLMGALEQAFQYDSEVLVEERIVGREMTCAVIEDASGVPQALPLIEIVPHASFFDFTAKYAPDGSDEICPAPVADDVASALKATAVTAHQLLGCAGFSRVDLFWTDGGPVVLEVNTIPGLTAQSLLPKAVRAWGRTLDDALAEIVWGAWFRHQRQKAPGQSGGGQR